jgi:chromate transporter
MYEVLWTSLKLGLSSFGGPIAHLGYFQRVYVQRERWLTGEEYASLVGLCQLLPGPTSSQVGLLIGLRRAGWRGALAAWVGFTLPSAVLMVAFAVFAPRSAPFMQPILHGLMLTAVAVIAQALWSMARSLCPDPQRILIAVLAAILLVVRGGTSAQLAAMALGACGGWLLCRRVRPPSLSLQALPRGRAGITTAAIFAVLLLALPVAAAFAPKSPVALAAIFYKAGALVFGGGHVVLPLLHEALVPPGWISDQTFLAGYGFVQAMPGPLFTISAYLGAVSAPPGDQTLWAAIALLAMFLPGGLLAIAGLSLWGHGIRLRSAQAILAGINAAVVGILAAALYNPVWVSSVHNLADAALAIVGFVLLHRWRTPPVLVVAWCVLASFGVTQWRELT